MPERGATCVPNDEPSPVSPPLFFVGQRVCIAGVKPGIVRFYGKTRFADGDWCGIELDESDGKHNGTVEGQMYFECRQGYGIFAPSHKVDALVVEKISKLQQPKSSGLKRLSKSRSRSPDASPSWERRSSKDPIDVVASLESGSQSAPQSPRFVSKLMRPKAKGLTTSQSDSDNLDGKAYPVNGEEATLEKTASQRPSKLPKQSSGLPIRRSHSALEPGDVKKYHSAIPKPGAKKECAQSTQQPNSGLMETYSLSDLKQARFDGKSVSRSERQVKARSLSHDLTSSESSQLGFPLGLDLKQKDAVHRSSNSSLCSQSSSKGSLSSPGHDLLTPSAIIAKKNPAQFGGEAMSEPEEEADFMAGANLSHASSLGILPDSVLCDNSLVTSELRAATEDGEPAKVQPDETESKESTEMMEKDLDHEISGISTPDMSSSTISGKDLCSSPDMDEARSLEMQNASVEQGKNDAPKAGENLATPASTSSESSPDSSITKIQTKPPTGLPALDKQPSRDSSFDSTANDDRAGSKRNSLSLMDDQQYPHVMRTAVDLDELDSSSMSASVEIAKTAVQQYAELMAAAEKERQASAKHREHMAARRAARRSSAGSERAHSYDSDSSDGELVLQRSASSGAVDKAQCERTQLMSDLEAGHAKQERPVSMISTGSADTGIVADLPGLPSTPRRRERPLSLISTTSVDTGYQPDTDSEVGTLTTNSPLDDGSPTWRAQPPDELSPRSAALSLDAAYHDTILNFQTATNKGSSTGSWPSEVTDSGIYRDTGTIIGESETGHETLHLDDLIGDHDLMGEQDLLEFGLGQMLDSMPGAYAGLGLGRGSPTGLGLLSPEEEPGSSTEEEDMALHEGILTPISDIHAPMETIPEQDTPESPDLDLASSLQLTNYKPASPIAARADTAAPIQTVTASCHEKMEVADMGLMEVAAEPSMESPKAYTEMDLNICQVTTEVLNEPPVMENGPVKDDNKAEYVNDDHLITSDEELKVGLKDEMLTVCREKADLEKSQIESETTTMYDSLDDINKVSDLPLDRSQFIDSLEQSQAEVLVNQVIVPEKVCDDTICDEVLPTDPVDTEARLSQTTISDSGFLDDRPVSIEEKDIPIPAQQNEQFTLFAQKTDAAVVSKETVEQGKTTICDSGFMDEKNLNIEDGKAVKLKDLQNVQLPVVVMLAQKPGAALSAETDEQSKITITNSGFIEEKQGSIEEPDDKTQVPTTEEWAMSAQEPGTKISAESVVHPDITRLDEQEPSGLIDDTTKTATAEASEMESPSKEVCTVETEIVKMDVSEVMAKTEDAPISLSEDTISITVELVDTVDQNETVPESTKEEVMLETLSRDSVQGLPPPLEPDVDSTASTTPESEVNQNFGASWTETGPPTVAVTPAEEECSIGAKVGNGELDAVVEEMISPEKAVEAEAGVLPSSVGDMICIRDAIPADAIGATAELTELAVEELILPAGATLVGSAVPQFASIEAQIIPECFDVKPKTIVDIKPEEDGGLVSSTAKHEEITEKEKASVDEDKDIVKETFDDVPTETRVDVPCIVNELVKPEDESLETHIESVTEHEVLVETLDVTEGPILRSSTPISEVVESHQSSSDDQEILEAEVVPELALSETHSANTTFTDGENVPLVEIEIVSASEMSESTMKDTGHEKGLKEKEKEGETIVDEKKGMKKNGTKLTKSKKIEDVAKADQKKTLSKTRTSLKDTKSKATTTGKTTVKDNSTLKNKVAKPNTTKTPLVKKSETEKKATTAKVGSRLIGNYNKEPPKPKTKEDNTAVVNNVKTAKNNNNMKKVDSGVGGDRKNPVAVQRRNPAPKSKWGNIMSQIDSGKSNKTETTTTKTKVESKTTTGKSNLNTSTSSVNRARTPRTALGSTVSTPRSTVTTPRTGPGSVLSTPRSPRDTTTRTTTANARRASSANAAEAKGKTTMSSTLRPGRPTSTGSNTGRVKQSPEPTRSESRQSNASESSVFNTSRNGSLPGSRPTSASKPGNRKTASLRRERSPSVGSEASGSSQVSSHGSRTPRTKEATPEPGRPKSAALTKRRSLAEPSTTRPGTATDKVEPRRSSLAMSSRLASKKEGSPSSVTDKKISMLPTLAGECF